MTKIFGQVFNPSRSAKALATAYAAIGATSAGMTYLLTSHGGNVDVLARSLFGTDAGLVMVGGLSGIIALHISRRWLGLSGWVGGARAIFGGCVMALVAAMIAGTLIAPLSGTFFAPIMVIAAFGMKPWLAVAWGLVVLMVHVLLVRRANDMRRMTQLADIAAVSQLSALSQAQFYRKRNHLH
ncbi:hypothetical protein SAMN04488005_1878 [Yoonia tamlensis]|uniref:Uncharacterized protein n=1 Tax=Yoonia tamlensis TaxID=390270 RepID=A0A1I6GLX6_9RHOB|nr:hypothetical protein [Yoonia tamlensis]SFR43225.1 hypothetical protein SAMN04488005_1878 [Yoonia tamlensis]